MMWAILKRKAASSYSFSLFNNALDLGTGSKVLKQFHQVRVSSFTPDLTTQMWSRLFSSNNGDLVDVFFPVMGKYIKEGTLSTFLKKPGDRVEFDESIAEIVTAKVTIDIITPEAGFIQEFVVKGGDTVEPGMKVAIISKPGEVATTHVAPSIFESCTHSFFELKKKRIVQLLVQ